MYRKTRLYPSHKHKKKIHANQSSKILDAFEFGPIASQNIKCTGKTILINFMTYYMWSAIMMHLWGKSGWKKLYKMSWKWKKKNLLSVQLSRTNPMECFSGSVLPRFFVFLPSTTNSFVTVDILNDRRDASKIKLLFLLDNPIHGTRTWHSMWRFFALLICSLPKHW